MKKFVMFYILFAVLLLSVQSTPAKDPTVVDAKHYTVVFENDQVRVLRIAYGPGEKSIMHDHPDGVAVFLNDQQVQFTFPDGTTKNVSTQKGDAIWALGGKHLPQNIGDQALELILVEMKGNKSSKSLRSAIDAKNASFMAAYNRGDAYAVAAHYTNDAHSLPPNSKMEKGRMAIQKSMETMFRNGEGKLQLTTMSVESNGNTAYEIGTYTMKMDMKGEAPMTDFGKYMVVWKKQDSGDWKLYADIWNSSLPVPGTP